MRKKHRKTLDAIFSRPTKASIKWDNVEALLKSFGAYIEERKGSRVAIELNDVVAIFHRPHPEKELDKGAVASIRRFLKEAGVEP
ncbi:MAG: type II toxin-antitoxin system HicA family toxin [Acidobacteria bacterium]|nr:type II toxin-antitoxin system HicA family toxin [Acidobacteriota bacterium]